VDFVLIPGTSWDTTSLPLGFYTLRAKVTDSAGNWANFDITVGVAAVVSAEEGIGATGNVAVVTWTTDRPTSSRVVYDTVSHSILDYLDSNYGYAYSVGSDTDTHVLNHSLTIPGVSAGTIYYYRTISAGSPVAVGGERTLQALTTAGPPPVSNSPVIATPVLAATTSVRTAGTSTNELVETPEINEVNTSDTANTEEVLGTTTDDAKGEESSQKPWLSQNKLTILIISSIILAIVIFFFVKRKKKTN